MSNEPNSVHSVGVGATAAGFGPARDPHARTSVPGRTHGTGAGSFEAARSLHHAQTHKQVQTHKRLLATLEDELTCTRAALRVTHEELQASKDELRIAEAQLRRLENGLHAVEEELRLGESRREEFLAMLSHELRNPLAAVLHATAILRLEASQGEPSSHGARARRVVERQSRHLARLLDDLLDVARISSGKLELRERACDLHDAIRGGVEALAPMLAARSLELRRELPDEPLPMRGDPARLQQVVANLLSNAAHHSDPRGCIELVVRRDDARAIVSLRDHGSGIDPELLPRIFEPFVQSQQALDRPRGGLGLGLTLVRHIVELHGGSVRARSDGDGQGSELLVTLPLALHLAREAASATAARSPATARPCRIVLVEDQPDAREMMRLLLTTRGHQVVEAEDGVAGVDAIERVRPHAALVDIGLPTMSGYDVARRIRGNRSLDSVTLVAITGYGAHADVEAARNAGFDEHLTKPADTQRLESILARCGPLQE
jgi:two-component system, chemotaxis family, CheB/CheR fusion protein